MDTHVTTPMFSALALHITPEQRIECQGALAPDGTPNPYIFSPAARDAWQRGYDATHNEGAKQ